MSSGAAQLIGEELMLPGQFAELYGHSTDLDPHRLLLFAVLASAIDDLRWSATGRVPGVKGGVPGQNGAQAEVSRRERVAQLREETIAWFESDEELDVCSFRFICGVLPGVDADYLLRGLRASNWNPPERMHRDGVARPNQVCSSKRKFRTREQERQAQKRRREREAAARLNAVEEVSLEDQGQAAVA